MSSRTARHWSIFASAARGSSPLSRLFLAAKQNLRRCIGKSSPRLPRLSSLGAALSIPAPPPPSRRRPACPIPSHIPPPPPLSQRPPCLSPLSRRPAHHASSISTATRPAPPPLFRQRPSPLLLSFLVPPISSSVCIARIHWGASAAGAPVSCTAAVSDRTSLVRFSTKLCSSCIPCTSPIRHLVRGGDSFV